jgi:hypothetical protein
MLGVMGEQRKADDVLHEKSGELFIAGGRGDGDGPDESSGSRVALFSSTSSLMVEDDHDEIESSLVVADPTTRSSSLAEHQLDGLSPLLANLSLRYTDLLFFCYLNYTVFVPNHHIGKTLKPSKSVPSGNERHKMPAIDGDVLGIEIKLTSYTSYI